MNDNNLSTNTVSNPLNETSLIDLQNTSFTSSSVPSSSTFNKQLHQSSPQPLSPLTSEALNIQQLFGTSVINPIVSTGSWLLEDYIHGNILLSTGYKELDKLLGGGINTNEVLELYGLSGSGKTQICMNIAISALYQSIRSSSSSSSSSFSSTPATIMYISTKAQQYDITYRMNQLLIETFKQELLSLNLPSYITVTSTESESSSTTTTIYSPTIVSLILKYYPHGFQTIYTQYQTEVSKTLNTTNNPTITTSIMDPLFIKYVYKHSVDCIYIESKYLLQYIRILTIMEPQDLLDNLNIIIQYCKHKDTLSTASSTSSTSLSIPILIILDSIYGIISPIMGGPRNFLGHGYMVEICHRLRWLASNYHIGIIITNNAVLERNHLGNDTSAVSKYSIKTKPTLIKNNQLSSPPSHPKRIRDNEDEEEIEPKVVNPQQIRFSRIPYYRSALGPSWGRLADTSLFIYREYGGNEEEWEYDITPEQERIIILSRSTRLVSYGFNGKIQSTGNTNTITTLRIRNSIDI